MRNGTTARLAGAWIGVLAALLLGSTGCSKNEGGTAAPTVSVSAGNIDTAATQPTSLDVVPDETQRPVVKIDTTLGPITVELDTQRAPVSVKNFLWYVNNGSYQETIFHQVLPGYVAIGGGYDEQFTMRPTHIEIRNEADNGLKNKRGTIAMARRPDVIDSSTNQFYFNLADNSYLDQKGRSKPEEFGYCVFGKVIDGMDVLDRLSAVPVKDTDKFTSTPATPVVIKSVSRVR